jgi:hypothetical protein
MARLLWGAALLVIFTNDARADPCRSGLKVNQRPGPYSSVVATGPMRGQTHCFICEAADRPIIIVFARSLSDPLGKLVRGIDKVIEQHKKSDVRAWVTFVGADQPTFDPHVVAWGQKQAIKTVALAIFEDADGPPTYLLNREADVTVLLSVKQRVRHNFAFRSGELTDAAIADILKSLPEITGAK